MSDAEIIALLSDDDVADRHLIESHIRECSRCATRAAVLRGQWNGFVGLLKDTESLISREHLPETLVEVQRRRRRSRRQSQLCWAAGIILLVGIAFATPVRAWVTDWISQQWVSVTGSSRAGESPMTPEPVPTFVPSTQTRHGLQFRPVGEEFTLVFSAAQRLGSITISMGNSPDAYIEVVNQTAADPMVVFPGSLRVRNGPISESSYKLVLSPNIRVFRLQVDGAAVAEIPTRQLGSGSRTLELRAQ